MSYNRVARVNRRLLTCQIRERSRSERSLGHSSKEGLLPNKSHEPSARSELFANYPFSQKTKEPIILNSTPLNHPQLNMTPDGEP